MAKKENRVSINKLDEFLQANEKSTVRHVLVFGDGQTLEFYVKRRLTIGEMYAAIDGIVDNSFVEGADSGIVEFNAVHHHAAVATYILTTVANFKPETATDKLVELYENPDVFAAIQDTWGGQCADFMRMVDEQIQWHKNTILATERTLLNDVSAKLDSAAGALVALTDSFKDVDPVAMTGIIEKLSGLDELQLARGILATQPDELTVVK